MSFIKKILELDGILKSRGVDIVTAKYMANKINNSTFDKGYYTIVDDDRKVMEFAEDKTYSLLLKKIYASIGSSNIDTTKEARKACGYPTNHLHSDEISKKRVFVVTERALGGIAVGYKYDYLNKISDKATVRLKCMLLYYNYFYNKSQTKIIITDTKRTPREQAEIVYKNVKENGGLASASMYKGNSGQFVEQELNKGTPETDIIDMLEAGIHNPPHKIGVKQLLNDQKERFTGFNHVNASETTCDIGTGNSNPWAQTDFVETLRVFMSQKKILDDRSLPLGSGNEKNCHHLVIVT